MSEDEAAEILAAILVPLVGKFLAASCGRRLYRALAGVDRAAIDALLAGYSKRAEST